MTDCEQIVTVEIGLEPNVNDFWNWTPQTMTKPAWHPLIVSPSYSEALTLALDLIDSGRSVRIVGTIGDEELFRLNQYEILDEASRPVELCDSW